MSIISVIIPVYNVEKYLKRCIESVLGQTFKKFELILIDDGSTDRSNEICQMYAKKDSRITILTKKNGGAASARNKGIDWVFENSNSKWIAFIDSDDWVESHYLELLYEAVIEKRTRISQCGVFDTDGKKELPKIKNNEYKLLSAEEVNCMRGVVAPTRKLYARECFKNIRYPEGKLFEDEFVTYKIIFACKQVAMIDAPLYAYYINPRSIMSQWNPKRLDSMEAIQERIKFFREKGLEELQHEQEKSYIWNIVNHIKEIEQSDDNIRKQYENKMRRLLRMELKKQRKRVDFKNNKWFYEAAYPRMMCIYWKIFNMCKKR